MDGQVARPRSVSDTDLLDAALSLMIHGGPEAVTFAAVSAATQLAPATLVQRFGSKAALLKVALVRAWDLLDAETEAAAAATPPTPEGAVAMLVRLSAGYPEGDAFADQLLLLREDLRDPELRLRGAAWRARLTALLAPRLADAAGPREDRAREMSALWQGALIWWAFEGDGTAAASIAATLRDWCARLG